MDAPFTEYRGITFTFPKNHLCGVFKIIVLIDHDVPVVSLSEPLQPLYSPGRNGNKNYKTIKLA